MLDFLDHCIRQWPSENYLSLKRSFFSRGNEIRPLDSVVEAQRGVYSSIRLCDVSIHLRQNSNIF